MPVQSQSYCHSFGGRSNQLAIKFSVFNWTPNTNLSQGSMSEYTKQKSYFIESPIEQNKSHPRQEDIFLTSLYSLRYFHPYLYLSIDYHQEQTSGIQPLKRDYTSTKWPYIVQRTYMAWLSVFSSYLTFLQQQQRENTECITGKG